MNKINKFIAFLLCLVFLVSSLNFNEFFSNKFNAAITSMNEKTFGYTGNAQTYTCEISGYYLLDVYGAQGGNDTKSVWDNSSATPNQGGKGGHIKSKVYLQKGTILYLYVGEKGTSGTTYDDNNTTVDRLDYYHKNSFNGGGAGCGSGSGDGGGSSDIRIGGTTLSHRILIAGGGGGASHYINGGDGGAIDSGNNGVLSLGTSSAVQGGGGGGGYYGGTSGTNNIKASYGGSNYFDDNFFNDAILLTNESGINEGNGFITITFCQNYSLTIDPNRGIYDNSTDIIYKTKNTSDAKITTFSYTGTIQEYTAQETGVYKFETYGAQGGASNRGNTGGYGGYSVGYMYINVPTKFYIVVGAAGNSNGTGGYNGGGRGGSYSGAGSGSYNGTNQAGGGGGATHIATTSGLLKNVAKSNLLLVAGGGGGASTIYNGGYGGGTTGNKGYGYGGAAGTQTSGYSYGQGGSVSGMNNGGGGSGLYGGYAASDVRSGGGGGGSGYISSSLFSSSTSTGKKSGNGYAIITYCPDYEIIKTPKREGYTFKGWSIKGKGTLINNVFIYAEGETVLTATWEKNIGYGTLIINPNGGYYSNNKNNTIITKTQGESVQITTPKYFGYIFSGWTFEGEGVFDDLSSTYTFGHESSATLTANWTKVTSNLTIDPNGGIYNNSSNNVYYNNKSYGDIQEIETPLKKGYTFNSWTEELGSDGWLDNYGWHFATSNAYLKANYYVNSYKLSINPNGGIWNETSNVQEFTISYNDTKIIPTPMAPVGYVFVGWTLTGTESTMSSLTTESTFKMGTSDATLTANYVEDKIPVTYIDIVDNISGTELGRKVIEKHYNNKVSGSDIGSSTADNTYYNGYYYVSDTSATVGTSGATVYRIFKLRTINITGTVSWTDNSNKWSTRPNEVTVSLYRDGLKVDSATGLTSSNSNNYSFNNVPKYSTSDGHVYNYTVSQSEVISKTYPEDKYTTTQSTYNFINNLGNTDTDNNKGLVVKGSIYWEDKGDTLGYRPKTVTITLYQNGIEYKTLEVDSFNDNTYEFSKLPKYDKDLNKYEYTVKETIVANYLVTENGQPVLKDAYSIKADTPNALDFTNVFNVPDSAPVPVKPEHENTVTVKTNTEDMITISLKGMETIINSDLSISYSDSYNGQVYNLSANNIGTVLSSMNSGKYEIDYFTTDYIINDIICDGDNNIWIEGNGDKYYLVIKDTNVDVSGTITLNFSKKDHIGYQTYVDVSNYFKVGIETTAIMSLESEIFAISDMIIEAEDAYSIIYNNSDTIDENIYNEGDEVEVLDYEGKLPENKEFLGWALLEDVEEPDYLVGDIISIKDMNISLYPVFKDIEEEISEIETTEETTESSESIEESSETEESTMEETSSEKEIFESEESSIEKEATSIEK